MVVVVVFGGGRRLLFLGFAGRVLMVVVVSFSVHVSQLGKPGTGYHL